MSHSSSRPSFWPPALATILSPSRRQRVTADAGLPVGVRGRQVRHRRRSAAREVPAHDRGLAAGGPVVERAQNVVLGELDRELRAGARGRAGVVGAAHVQLHGPLPGVRRRDGGPQPRVGQIDAAGDAGRGRAADECVHRRQFSDEADLEQRVRGGAGHEVNLDARHVRRKQRAVVRVHQLRRTRRVSGRARKQRPRVGRNASPRAAGIGAGERVVHDQRRLRRQATRHCRHGDDAAAGARRRRQSVRVDRDHARRRGAVADHRRHVLRLAVDRAGHHVLLRGGWRARGDGDRRVARRDLQRGQSTDRRAAAATAGARQRSAAARAGKRLFIIFERAARCREQRDQRDPRNRGLRRGERHTSKNLHWGSSAFYAGATAADHSSLENRIFSGAFRCTRMSAKGRYHRRPPHILAAGFASTRQAGWSRSRSCPATTWAWFSAAVRVTPPTTLPIRVGSR